MLSVSEKICFNPECEEVRCRICYEMHLPLITLCQCAGTIAYVHEDCILDWITKKMESAENVEIPKCEICRGKYSAKMKIGQKKVCYKTLGKKIWALPTKELLLSVMYILGTLYCLYAAMNSVGEYVFGGVLKGVNGVNGVNASDSNTNTNTNNNATASPSQLLSERENSIPWLQFLYFHIVFPVLFIREAFRNLKWRARLADDCMVQVVELTLNPRVTLKK